LLQKIKTASMKRLETYWKRSLTRRNALRRVAAFLAASPLARAQQDPFRDHSRVPAMDELLTAFDFESVAYAKLPREAYDYTSYGAAGEFTLRRNRGSFDWVELVPKSVVDVSSVETAAEILGTKMPFPIMVAPSAGHLALHPEGEAATHQGTTAAGTPMIVSYVASLPIDKIAAAAAGPLWYQLYPRQELEENREPLDKAQLAGCQAIVVTVDQQAAYYERRLHDRNLLAREGRENPRAARSRSARRGGVETSTLYRIQTGRLWYEWKLFDELRPFIQVPLLAKGVLTAEDARRCLDHGLDGIIVSNHGGRALDYSPSSLEVLPEIVEAVAGKVPVLIDGGFRRGSDILKALALGADAVCLGRVPRWGLGSFGAPGVQRVLEILQSELALAMAQTGRPTLASIDQTLVRTDFP
jgi:isopentenyl diphosphate isomerase/L-lactate dehydrogenase-like FMN-dependent dehydrogenase